MTHNIHFYADDTALCIWLNQHYNVYFNTSRNISAEEVWTERWYSKGSFTLSSPSSHFTGLWTQQPQRWKYLGNDFDNSLTFPQHLELQKLKIKWVSNIRGKLLRPEGADVTQLPFSMEILFILLHVVSSESPLCVSLQETNTVFALWTWVTWSSLTTARTQHYYL